MLGETANDLAWPACPYEVRAASADVERLSDDTLCQLTFDATGTHGTGGDARHIRVPLAPLATPDAAGVCWHSRLPVRSGWCEQVGWTVNGVIAFVHLQVPEAELDGDFESAVGGAYHRLLGVARDAGYPEPLRVWNYLSAINAGDGERERYRRFCVGRYPVLAAVRGFERHLPAATAIGSATGKGLVVFALCGRQPGMQVENPQQVSAFRYPPAYGRRSPSFSRATLVPWADGARLMVSGTSSIVGHASVHVGDPVAQLERAMQNIAHLRDAAVRRHLPQRAATDLQLESALVYVRRPHDASLLVPRLPALFGAVQPRLLQGDICRRELRVEVEAVYRSTP
ncbi:MAG TPA: hypothetical protein VFQ88_14440 [Nevskiaceae bacterium]|nr:hypothetical protein [Nevskiaceae bacterium]